jgi:hypothetical protein
VIPVRDINTTPTPTNTRALPTLKPLRYLIDSPPRAITSVTPGVGVAARSGTHAQVTPRSGPDPSVRGLVGVHADVLALVTVTVTIMMLSAPSQHSSGACLSGMSDE